MLDQIRRLDRRLGVFLDRVQAGRKVGCGGVQRGPWRARFAERLQDQGIPGEAHRYCGVDEGTAIQSAKGVAPRPRTCMHCGQRPFPERSCISTLRRRGSSATGKEWIAKVVASIRSMPDIAAVASFDELAALPGQDDSKIPARKACSTGSNTAPPPSRAGEILFAFQSDDRAGRRRPTTIRRSTGPLMTMIGACRSSSGAPGEPNAARIRSVPWTSPRHWPESSIFAPRNGSTASRSGLLALSKWWTTGTRSSRTWPKAGQAIRRLNPPEPPRSKHGMFLNVRRVPG